MADTWRYILRFTSLRFSDSGGFLCLGLKRPLVRDFQWLQPAQAHEAKHVAGMTLGQNSRAAQLAAFVAGSAAHQMRRKAMVAFHFSGLGDLESLGDTFAGLVFVTHRFLVK